MENIMQVVIVHVPAYTRVPDWLLEIFAGTSFCDFLRIAKIRKI